LELIIEGNNVKDRKLYMEEEFCPGFLQLSYSRETAGRLGLAANLELQVRPTAVPREWKAVCPHKESSFVGRHS
jgi:hypothetical protein